MAHALYAIVFGDSAVGTSMIRGGIYFSGLKEIRIVTPSSKAFPKKTLP